MKKYKTKDIQNFNNLPAKDKIIAKRMMKKMNDEIKNNQHPAVEFFKKNSYVKIENLIAKNIVDFLYEYVKLQAIRLDVVENLPNKNSYGTNDFGTFKDLQAPGNFSIYGDLIMETSLLGCLNSVEQFTGLKLIPTYAYHRLYTQGAELKKHKDRESCEISATVCLGYDYSNIDNYNWPMFVKKNNEEIGVNLNPGDCIIYKGCEVEHWREPFIGLNQAQLFLHYNVENGKFNIKYDNRPALGLPKNIKN